MITIIRWWIYKARVIKLKLSLITIAEDFVKKLTDKESEVYKTFADELMKVVHTGNRQNAGVKNDTQS